jgi:hypothetical protein
MCDLTTTEVALLFDFIFKFIASFAVIWGFFQLMEVRKKRLIDMYWKIGDLYSSQEQRNARKNIRIIGTNFLQDVEVTNENIEELSKKYNEKYHKAKIDSSEKEIDSSILNHLRFLNQLGVLLKRNIIDEDMLFGLIGVSLKIHYPIIRMILKAHRDDHKTPHLYSDLEITLERHEKWANRKNY